MYSPHNDSASFPILLQQCVSILTYRDHAEAMREKFIFHIHLILCFCAKHAKRYQLWWEFCDMDNYLSGTEWQFAFPKFHFVGSNAKDMKISITAGAMFHVFQQNLWHYIECTHKIENHFLNRSWLKELLDGINREDKRTKEETEAQRC